MFFYLSKFAWFIVAPGNLFFLLLITGAILLFSRWKRIGRLLLTCLALTALCIALFPIGKNTITFFEDRFQKPYPMPNDIDGIIVLGGVLSPSLTNSRGEHSYGGAIERVFAFAALSKQYSSARLVFTGGSGDPLRPELSEAIQIKPLLVMLSMDLERIEFETKSRNTYENAQLTYEMVKPDQDEKWLLITSAFHMPRAMGAFRKIGWPNLIAYPVDYGTYAKNDWSVLQFDLTLGLSFLNAASHEALGMLIYFLTGKTDALFPSDKPNRS